MIPFNIPAITGKEKEYIDEVLGGKKICGDGPFTKKCQHWLENYLNVKKVLLTTSCTDALEMAALLLNIQTGDEVIMPSFTFVSSANPFVLRGANIIFVDINPFTMNIDEKKIESAISSKTKAILVVHYAGWSADMDSICEIAKKFNIPIIEDAAQALGSKYKGKHLGSLGSIACFSFHETKNINCGEGGAIVINDSSLVLKSEIIREKGTNRSQFIRGQIDKYTWIDIGSSFLPSELNAAFLMAQLESLNTINSRRLELWNNYKDGLSNKFEILDSPNYCDHNAHLFAIKLQDIDERTKFIDHLKRKNIQAVFHYIPLHSSPAGAKYGRMFGDDEFTSHEASRLVRLPIYYKMENKEQDYVINAIKSFGGN